MRHDMPDTNGNSFSAVLPFAANLERTALAILQRKWCVRFKHYNCISDMTIRKSGTLVAKQTASELYWCGHNAN